MVLAYHVDWGTYGVNLRRVEAAAAVRAGDQGAHTLLAGSPAALTAGPVDACGLVSRHSSSGFWRDSDTGVVAVRTRRRKRSRAAARSLAISLRRSSVVCSIVCRGICNSRQHRHDAGCRGRHVPFARRVPGFFQQSSNRRRWRWYEGARAVICAVEWSNLGRHRRKVRADPYRTKRQRRADRRRV